ncbi:hypothetical protein SAMN05444280_111103 [Tangfeifania diversioriginum]|uniref:SGNH/GDSL hydrolase family protein n=1 Tax=Tangfeifania diversioriginum TaxID=1168035 RepID=A0A1M6GSJ6_9BACT|nr:hypothetical protein [Tangfeifania diversioriginum]SHJ12846.1 hypothetical protein SAMN05444280_111103 [Tangfeifania diversioriginum]
MKFNYLILGGAILLVAILLFRFFNKKESGNEYKILFLHHSTGNIIKNAGSPPIRYIGKLINQKSFVAKWLEDYNEKHGTNYVFEEQFFPKKKPYGWNNYPYDYYNIWVKNAGEAPYMNEPTLEILTKKYNMIVFKHCFPVSDIDEDINQPDINSPEKRIENYKLQYNALKQKMLEFPDTKFLVWTGAARVEKSITKERAQRAKSFFDWVRKEWDTPDDNIYIWDFYDIETEGDLYLKPEYASSPTDSHPNKILAEKAAPLLCQRIVEITKLSKQDSSEVDMLHENVAKVK